MIIVLRKSTVRPRPSVSRPSSSICRRALNTSGCAFQSHQRVPRCKASCAPLRSAALLHRSRHTRRGGSYQARDGMLLHILGHIETYHTAFISEQGLGQCPAELCFPYLLSGPPRKMKLPTGRFGSLIPLRALITASATALTASSCPITRRCRISSSRTSFRAHLPEYCSPVLPSTGLRPGRYLPR